MVPFLMRGAFILGGCTGLVACSQQPVQSVSADAQPSRARLCIAEGRPVPGNSADPDRAVWSITVSSEGGPCSHVREWVEAEQFYQVLSAPRHGRLTQESRDGKTVVSYWPERGYIGSDSFSLLYQRRNVALPYLVGVVP
jgi:hypothetical protein